MPRLELNRSGRFSHAALTVPHPFPDPLARADNVVHDGHQHHRDWVKSFQSIENDLQLQPS